jgi:hypothetical protein
MQYQELPDGFLQILQEYFAKVNEPKELEKISV